MKNIGLTKYLKKEKSQKTDDITQNNYYENISAHLGIFQVVLYFTLLSFVILSFVSNSSLITYRNFYYFFKDLDASAESIDVLKSDSVTYPTSDSQVFTLYRGGLAVIGNHSVTAFTPTGRQTVSQSIQYRNPMAEGKGRYLMVYEMGGTQYSLYNSYTRLYSDITEYPINGVAVSDSGVYAILSSSGEFTSVVSLYNDNFALINRYNKNSFVTDVAISEKGDLVAMLTADPVGGVFEAGLELYVPGSGEVEKKIVLGEEMALSCQFTSSGNVAVILTDSIMFLSRDGEVISTYHFQGEKPTIAEIGADGAALILRSSAISSKNHIIVFDKSGKMVYNEVVDIEAVALSRSGDSVFLMTSAEIQRLSLRNGRFSSLDYHTDIHSILAVSENELLICSPQKAEYLRF